MTNKSYKLLWLLLAAAPARSDTINKKDHVSINGTIKMMSNGVLILEEQTSSDPNILRIPVADVESIEFNTHTSNVRPTSPVGIGGPVSPTSTTLQSVTGDVIVLRSGGGRQKCKLLSIDANQVHCSLDVVPSQQGYGQGGRMRIEGDTAYNRSRVLRILLGAQ